MDEKLNLFNPFKIGSVTFPSRVVLAPMDGYTDSPFRLLCRKHGSAASISEFINGIDVIYGHPHLKYKTYYIEAERPFVYQIFDDNPERLLETAKRLSERQPDIIDINMGCSAKNVSNRGAGAGLLKDPQKVARMTSLLVSSLDLPITAKIRLGWDDGSKNYLDIARILEDNGISAITLHARTRRQEYSGKADWDAIGEIKSQVNVPVIGNGDVHSLADARTLMGKSNCDAIMIGRAALGNPWVFQFETGHTIPPLERYNVIQEHLSRMNSLYPPRVAILMFRKHLVRYLHNYLTTPDIRRHVFSIEDGQELLSEIQMLLLKKGIQSDDQLVE